MTDPACSFRVGSGPSIVSRRRFLGALGAALPFTAARVRGQTKVDASVARPDWKGSWEPIFDGKTLNGWTPKFTGYPVGENFGRTFRVENGLLRVAYDGYDKFEGRFGHLFYKEKLSQYVVRLEYRFVGQQTPGGPGWAFRNSGIMLHGQAPETMELRQEFPASIEVQLLGGDGTHPRSTANLCTPGTHVVMADKLITQHCTNSTSKTYHGDVWVTVEIEVRGHEQIRHLIDGETVLAYTKPQLDDGDPDGKRLLAAGAPRMIREGYLSLQAESHAVDFRKVEILRLG